MKLIIVTGLLAGAIGTGVYFIGGWSLILASIAVPAFVVTGLTFTASVAIKPITMMVEGVANAFEQKQAA